MPKKQGSAVARSRKVFVYKTAKDLLYRSALSNLVIYLSDVTEAEGDDASKFLLYVVCHWIEVIEAVESASNKVKLKEHSLKVIAQMVRLGAVIQKSYNVGYGYLETFAWALEKRVVPLITYLMENCHVQLLDANKKPMLAATPDGPQNYFEILFKGPLNTLAESTRALLTGAQKILLPEDFQLFINQPVHVDLEFVGYSQTALYALIFMRLSTDPHNTYFSGEVINIFLQFGADQRVENGGCHHFPLMACGRIGSLHLSKLFLRHAKQKLLVQAPDDYQKLLDVSLWSCLYAWVENENVYIGDESAQALVPLLLAAGANPTKFIEQAQVVCSLEEIVDSEGLLYPTALHIVCNQGFSNIPNELRIAVIRKASQYGSESLNVRGKIKGFSALHQAVISDCHVAVLALFKTQSDGANPDINLECSKGNVPLYYAISRQNFRMVQLLLHFGAFVNYLHPETNLTVIEDVIGYFNGTPEALKIVELLIPSGSEAASPTPSPVNKILGCSPLHVACHYGQHVLVKRFLQDNPADISVLTVDGQFVERDESPLSMVATASPQDYEKEHERFGCTLNYLLERGADFCGKYTRLHFTILQYAAYKNNTLLGKDILKIARDSKKFEILWVEDKHTILPTIVSIILHNNLEFLMAIFEFLECQAEMEGSLNYITIFVTKDSVGNTAFEIIFALDRERILEQYLFWIKKNRKIIAREGVHQFFNWAVSHGSPHCLQVLLTRYNVVAIFGREEWGNFLLKACKNTQKKLLPLKKIYILKILLDFFYKNKIKISAEILTATREFMQAQLQRNELFHAIDYTLCMLERESGDAAVPICPPDFGVGPVVKGGKSIKFTQEGSSAVALRAGLFPPNSAATASASANETAVIATDRTAEKIEWFAGLLSSVDSRVMPVRNSDHAFVYFDESALRAEGCPQKYLDMYCGSDGPQRLLKFSRKQLGQLLGDFDARVIIPGSNVAVRLPIRYECRLDNTEYRIFLGVAEATRGNACLLIGLMYADALHSGSAVKRLNEQSRPIAILQTLQPSVEVVEPDVEDAQGFDRVFTP